jgi:hypothetical protein
MIHITTWIESHTIKSCEAIPVYAESPNTQDT